MGDFSATIHIVIAKQFCSSQLYQATYGLYLTCLIFSWGSGSLTIQTHELGCLFTFFAASLSFVQE